MNILSAENATMVENQIVTTKQNMYNNLVDARMKGIIILDQMASTELIGNLNIANKNNDKMIKLKNSESTKKLKYLADEIRRRS